MSRPLEFPLGILPLVLMAIFVYGGSANSVSQPQAEYTLERQLNEMKSQMDHLMVQFRKLARQNAELKEDVFQFKLKLQGKSHLDTGTIQSSASVLVGQNVRETMVDSKETRAISMPNGCKDLQNLGYGLNGFYTVTNSNDRPNKLETVFCNFNLTYLNPSFETRLGFSDIKTTSVYFAVQRKSAYSAVGTTIPFESEISNVGGGMNTGTGIFTAPHDGIYFFSFTGVKNWDLETLRVYLRYSPVNSSMFFDLGTALGHGPYIATVGYGLTASTQSTVALKKGDSVFLYLHAGQLQDEATFHYTTFTGYAIAEDLNL